MPSLASTHSISTAGKNYKSSPFGLMISQIGKRNNCYLFASINWMLLNSSSFQAASCSSSTKADYQSFFHELRTMVDPANQTKIALVSVSHDISHLRKRQFLRNDFLLFLFIGRMPLSAAARTEEILIQTLSLSLKGKTKIWENWKMRPLKLQRAGQSNYETRSDNQRWWLRSQCGPLFAIRHRDPDWMTKDRSPAWNKYS